MTEIEISYQVCDRDEIRVDYNTRLETRKATVIGQVDQLCAMLVQVCYILAGTTRGLRCLRNGDRDIVVVLIGIH